MPYYTAIVILVSVAFYFFLATRVAVAHGKFDVRLPSTTGSPEFERIHRVQQSREERLPGFFLQSTACILLFIGACVGILMHGTGG